MTCPHCAATLESGARFCGHCGRDIRTRRTTLVGSVVAQRYRIDARIAAGGFGAIYRATDLQTGTVVALKVLHAELAGDPRLAARFRREGAAQSSLTSPHTVATHDVGEAADGTLYIAMELLHGESLLDRFRRVGALPWRRVVVIARAVCASLAEAHALGIVHRDLKPANIHLERRGGTADFVKVLDFGIAKLLRGSSSDLGGDDELTLTGQAIGTLEYMSPEQLVGSECDGRTDIYTLGVVAYELLTGTRPFADATGPTTLITALLTRSPAPPTALAASPIPPALDGILLRCLARDPEDRYATVDELAAALDQVLAIRTLPTLARVEPDDEATWIGPQREPLHAPIAWHAAPQPVIEQAMAWHAAMHAPAPAAPMPPFVFDVRGSAVGPPPIAIAMTPPRWPRWLGWGALLLASGTGLGAVLASLL